jgi:hypothetical protein
MGLVSGMYHIKYSFIPTHTNMEEPAWQCSEILQTIHKIPQTTRGKRSLYLQAFYTGSVDYRSHIDCLISPMFTTANLGPPHSLPLWHTATPHRGL